MKKIEIMSDPHSGLHIDLHVHTDISGDGRSSQAALARAAAARGLDAIVLTDHGACALDKPVKYGSVWLLPGCECSTDAGHILGLFPDRVPDFDVLYANGLPEASETISMLHECGAVTVLAHPYTRADSQPDAPVDLVECANSRVYFKNSGANRQAFELAELLSLPATGGSDAHAAPEVGNAYTIVDAPDCSLSALREALLAGRCRPVLVKNTPRRFKGLSQFRFVCRYRRSGRILTGLAYICYCVLLDIVKGTK